MKEWHWALWGRKVPSSVGLLFCHKNFVTPPLPFQRILVGGGGNSTFVPLVPNLVRTSYDNGYLGPTRLGRDARSELGQGVGTENSPLAWGRPRTCPSVAGRDTQIGRAHV